MTHLAFVATSYALAVAIPLGFAAAASRRLAVARRRLASLGRGPGR